MSKIDLIDSKWVDLVFENKNKEYGAYKLRKDSGKRNVKALVIVLVSIAAIWIGVMTKVAIENSMKSKAMEMPAIAGIISQMEEKMDGNGRILVRPSGTEPLLRIMAEAPTDEEVDFYVDTIAAVVRDEIGLD